VALERVRREDLYARRGADFGPYGWLLNDTNGDPITDPANIEVRARVFSTADPDPIYEFGDAQAILLGLPDGSQQVAVLLSASEDETALWGWDTLPYVVTVTRLGREDPIRVGRLIMDGSS
jgi:hypothetical protein